MTLLGRLAAFVLSVVVTIVLITSIWWRLVPERDIDVLVYDQTVPSGVDADRAMLQQLLDHHHVGYDQNDCFGSKPGGTAPHGTWPSERPDLIVLADVFRPRDRTDASTGWIVVRGCLRIPSAAVDRSFGRGPR
ncbi:MAG: hypothetical protein O3C27_06835 [Actinomycetota bacterium]|nr:hypothetical protein [Actinomycetota bacterium]